MQCLAQLAPVRDRSSCDVIVTSPAEVGVVDDGVGGHVVYIGCQLRHAAEVVVVDVGARNGHLYREECRIGFGDDDTDDDGSDDDNHDDHDDDSHIDNHNNYRPPSSLPWESSSQQLQLWYSVLLLCWVVWYLLDQPTLTTAVVQCVVVVLGGVVSVVDSTYTDYSCGTVCCCCAGWCGIY